jgi:hypothetical protein
MAKDNDIPKELEFAVGVIIELRLAATNSIPLQTHFRAQQQSPSPSR